MTPLTKFSSSGMSSKQSSMMKPRRMYTLKPELKVTFHAEMLHGRVILRKKFVTVVRDEDVAEIQLDEEHDTS